MVSPIRDGRIIFLDPDNLLNVVRFASENGIISVGMTLVILTGGIDLSVGALLALCGVGAAACLKWYGLNTPLTVLIVLALGAFLGTVNGLVTTKLRIQSFITTLAMLSVARGVASLWSGGYAIPLAFGTAHGEAPPLFQSLFAGQITLGSLAIPGSLFYFAMTGLAATFLLRRTGFGRHVYAVGGNETAARLSGGADRSGACDRVHHLGPAGVPGGPAAHHAGQPGQPDRRQRLRTERVAAGRDRRDPSVRRGGHRSSAPWSAH